MPSDKLDSVAACWPMLGVPDVSQRPTLESSGAPPINIHLTQGACVESVGLSVRGRGHNKHKILPLEHSYEPVSNNMSLLMRVQ